MNNHSTTQTTHKQDLVITRRFDAPVEQVWRAWTDPELVMCWWGPEHFTCPTASMDVREGGTSLVCMRAPQDFGGQDMYSTWAYRKVVPLEQIEFVQNLADPEGRRADPSIAGMPPDFPQDVLSRITFKALNDHQTELTITEFGYESAQWLDLSRQGMEQCLDKMARCLG